MCDSLLSALCPLLELFFSFFHVFIKDPPPTTTEAALGVAAVNRTRESQKPCCNFFFFYFLCVTFTCLVLLPPRTIMTMKCFFNAVEIWHISATQNRSLFTAANSYNSKVFFFSELWSHQADVTFAHYCCWNQPQQTTVYVLLPFLVPSSLMKFILQVWLQVLATLTTLWTLQLNHCLLNKCLPAQCGFLTSLLSSVLNAMNYWFSAAD